MTIKISMTTKADKPFADFPLVIETFNFPVFSVYQNELSIMIEGHMKMRNLIIHSGDKLTVEVL